MKLTCYSWSTCAHTVHLDASGQRMGVNEVLNPDNRPITHMPASFACPACEHPESNQDGVGIRPIQQIAPISMTPAESNQCFNPRIAEFHSIRQQTNPYVDPDGTNGHITAIQSENNYDSVNGTTYYSYPSSSINAPTGDNHPPHSANGVNISNSMHDADNHDHSYNIYLHPTPGSNLYSSNMQSVSGYGYMPHSSADPNTYHGYSTETRHADYHDSTSHIFSDARNQMLVSYSAPSTEMVRYDPSIAERQMTLPVPKDTHKPGTSCPDGHPNCHWEYSRWCHEAPATCRSALQAITAAFHAHGPWKNAPSGWNEMHKDCVRAVEPIMCEFHLQLHRRVFGSSYDQARRSR